MSAFSVDEDFILALAEKSAAYRERLNMCQLPKFFQCRCQPAWVIATVIGASIPDRMVTMAAMMNNLGTWSLPPAASACVNCHRTSMTRDDVTLWLPCRCASGVRHRITVPVCDECARRLALCTKSSAPPFEPKSPMEKFCYTSASLTEEAGAPDDNWLPDAQVCANQQCGGAEQRRLPKFSRCMRCKSAYYCSAACQRTHWKAHRPRCADVVAAAEGAATI